MRKIISKILNQNSKNQLHKLEASWSVLKHGNPGKKIKVIGVTGTKGKTTIANMIASILDASGIKNAMETTINTKIGNERFTHQSKVRWVTTPPSSVIQSFLKKAVKAGCEYAILEVTSQAIDQNRIHGIKFDTVVFSNLSQDHLDYHKTRANYLEAKLKLFKDNPHAKSVINMDDQIWEKFYDLPSAEKLLYSTKSSIGHGVVARKILTSPSGVTFTAAHDEGQNIVNLKLPGIFNVSNALAAFCVGLALKIDPEKIVKGLEDIELVPGRMEPIKVSPDQDFTVIVDYAHNADSLKNVYETVRDGMANTRGRLIAVLGATGRRDKTKRPIMGALAGHYADLVIFTNEDPYDEDPMTIIEEVAAGIFKGGDKKHQWRLNRDYWKVLDRAQAIHKAIKEAKKNDVVVITGKGAEEVMAIGPIGEDKFIPFSDREVSRNELEARFKVYK